MKISAYVNALGELSSLCKPGSLRLYMPREEENRSGWHLLQEVPLTLDYEAGIPVIKAALHEAVARLDGERGCRVLVSAEVRGMLYTVFQEELQYRIWKSEGPLFQQLDMVRGKEMELEAKKRYDLIALAGKPVPTPMLIGSHQDGCFWIDLKDALAHESGPTSREILIPFMERRLFRKLEVLCDHLPKWLSWELERLDMSAESEAIDATGNGVKVSIYPRNTPEGRARKVGLLGGGAALLLPCPRELARRKASDASENMADVVDWTPVARLKKG